MILFVGYCIDRFKWELKEGLKDSVASF